MKGPYFLPQLLCTAGTYRFSEWESSPQVSGPRSRHLSRLHVASAQAPSQPQDRLVMDEESGLLEPTSCRYSPSALLRRARPPLRTEALSQVVHLCPSVTLKTSPCGEGIATVVMDRPHNLMPWHDTALSPIHLKSRMLRVASSNPQRYSETGQRRVHHRQRCFQVCSRHLHPTHKDGKKESRESALTLPVCLGGHI